MTTREDYSSVPDHQRRWIKSAIEHSCLLESLSREELAYAAGIIDGEGTITVGISKRCSQVQLNVKVRVVDKVLIDWLAERFGTIKLAVYQGWKSPRPIYGWQLTGMRAQNFLRAICPFMVIKKQRAELCLDFFKLDRAGKIDVHDRVCSLNQRKSQNVN